MNSSKQKKLEKAGWKVGSAAEFLGLSPVEEVLVDVKIALAGEVKERRKRQKVTQEGLAKRMGSSQSRIAKMESADRSVSVDLLVRSLASLGASPREIGGAISKRIGAPTTRSGNKKKSNGKKRAVRKRTVAPG
jgi:DNA-binding XRE family transcriptional regulator